MATPERHVTAAADRVPWNQLIAFGMGGLIPIAIFNIAGLLMGLLGNISLGLSAFWLGTIMIIPRLCDAIVDPLIGHFSDNTRTRWGRRRPYIFFGGIFTALSFIAMWWVPRGEWVKSFLGSGAAFHTVQLAFILAAMLVFYSSTTIFEIPHGALGMEMSGDYHERTRLFSAKSFLGNLFAMGTPWLLKLAGLDLFAGPGGDLVSGMHTLSILIAAMLIPLTVWWLFALKEPGFAVAKEQRKGGFWKDMRATARNKTFLNLVAIIFTLAMGFNFVSLFGYYIQIFFLYGGDEKAAGTLLGITGTVWAVTALVAVFPLNWLSKRYGKNMALLTAILLMCAAQLSKIVCYRPGVFAQIDVPSSLRSIFPNSLTIPGPYLVLIPTMLLSAGMLMFFTLGSSMVGDVCDEDELNTGTRSEGSYYAVFWWFIKMGTAFASFVTGLLLLFTTFDQQQNVSVDDLIRNIASIKVDAEGGAELPKRSASFDKTTVMLKNLRDHFNERFAAYPDQADHTRALIAHTDAVLAEVTVLCAENPTTLPAEFSDRLDALVKEVTNLKQQSPQTLFRLRFVEIGLPLVLSAVSIFLTLRYPLTEARCYEIKESLKKRHAAKKAAASP